MELTEAQVRALENIKQRWAVVSEPWSLPCDDCVMVNVSSECGSVHMSLGIESDGYTHS